jgi:hypothetical protein
VLWVVNASSPTALARITINRVGDGIPVSLGFAMRTPPFNRIFVSNTAQAAQFLEVVYFRSQFDFFVVNPSIASPTISVAKPTSGANARIALAPGVNSALVNADATRRAVIVKNEGPDQVRVAWNATPPTDSLGIPLAAGESITLEGTPELDGRVAAAGVASAVNVITIND